MRIDHAGLSFEPHDESSVGVLLTRLAMEVITGSSSNLGPEL